MVVLYQNGAEIASHLYSSQLDVIRNEPGQAMAQEKHHDVPAEHMVRGPADDKTGHKALGDGLDDGGRQHVDSQFGPPIKSRLLRGELSSIFAPQNGKYNHLKPQNNILSYSWIAYSDKHIKR